MKPYWGHANYGVLKQLSSAFHHRNEVQVEALFADIRRSGSADWAAWDMMIRGYLYLKKRQTAEALFSELKEPQNLAQLTAMHYQRFIFHACYIQYDHRRASSYIDEMEHRGIVPTEKSFVLIANALFYRDRDYQGTIHFIKRAITLLRRKSLYSPRLLTRAMQCHVNLAQHPQVVQLFGEVLSALDAQKAVREQTFQETKEVRHGLATPAEPEEEAEEEEDSNDGDGDEKDGEEGSEQREMLPEEFATALAMRSCLSVGDAKLAKELFSEARARNFRLHQNAVHMAAQIALKDGGVQGLQSFLTAMIESAPQPDAGGFSSILQVFGTTTQYNLAYEAFKTINTKVSDPVVRMAVLAQIMDIYGKDNKLGEAAKLIDEAMAAADWVVQRAKYTDIFLGRHLLSSCLITLSKLNQCAKMEAVWNKFTGSRSKGGMGVKPTSWVLATLCEAFARDFQFDKAFSYAEQYMQIARERKFHLHYYFATTFVAKVVIKAQLRLGRGYRGVLGRWLDCKGPMGKHVMSYDDTMDFINDFNSWHHALKAKEAQIPISHK